jgi:hypothetical protein
MTKKSAELDLDSGTPPPINDLMRFLADPTFAAEYLNSFDAWKKRAQNGVGTTTDLKVLFLTGDMQSFVIHLLINSQRLERPDGMNNEQLWAQVTGDNIYDLLKELARTANLVPNKERTLSKLIGLVGNMEESQSPFMESGASMENWWFGFKAKWDGTCSDGSFEPHNYKANMAEIFEKLPQFHKLVMYELWKEKKWTERFEDRELFWNSLARAVETTFYHLKALKTREKDPERYARRMNPFKSNGQETHVGARRAVPDIAGNDEDDDEEEPRPPPPPPVTGTSGLPPPPPALGTPQNPARHTHGTRFAARREAATKGATGSSTSANNSSFLASAMANLPKDPHQVFLDRMKELENLPRPHPDVFIGLIGDYDNRVKFALKCIAMYFLLDEGSSMSFFPKLFLENVRPHIQEEVAVAANTIVHSINNVQAPVYCKIVLPVTYWNKETSSRHLALVRFDVIDAPFILISRQEYQRWLPGQVSARSRLGDVVYRQSLGPPLFQEVKQGFVMCVKVDNQYDCVMEDDEEDPTPSEILKNPDTSPVVPHKPLLSAPPPTSDLKSESNRSVYFMKFGEVDTNKLQDAATSAFERDWLKIPKEFDAQRFKAPVFGDHPRAPTVNSSKMAKDSYALLTFKPGCLNIQQVDVDLEDDQIGEYVRSMRESTTLEQARRTAEAAAEADVQANLEEAQELEEVHNRAVAAQQTACYLLRPDPPEKLFELPKPVKPPDLYYETPVYSDLTEDFKAFLLKVNEKYFPLAEKLEPIVNYTGLLALWVLVEEGPIFEDEYSFGGPWKTTPCRDEFILDPKKPLGHPSRKRYTPKSEEATARFIKFAITTGVAEFLKGGAKHSSPLHIIPKEDGTDRAAVDVRGVNAVTVPLAMPQINVANFLASIMLCKFFGKLDCVQSFWQLPLHVDNRVTFAIWTPQGILVPNRVLQGAKNSTVHLLSSLFEILGDLFANSHCGVIFYVDDILIYSETFAERRWKEKRDMYCT